MIACTTGQTDIVKLLVSRGASWNVTNKVSYCSCIVSLIFYYVNVGGFDAC